MIDIGGIYYEINIGDIISAAKDTSKPSPGMQRGASVIIEVNPAAIIRESKEIVAGALGKQIGRRPLVFAMPSEAEKYSIPVASSQFYPQASVTIESTLQSMSFPPEKLTVQTLDTRWGKPMPYPVVFLYNMLNRTDRCYKTPK